MDGRSNEDGLSETLSAQFDNPLPAAVQAIQLRFEGGGERCCLAIDRDDAESPPILVDGRRHLVVANLPAGPAQVTVFGFPSAAAPAPSGFSARCETNPSGLGRACDGAVFATASFGSVPTGVEVVAAARVPVQDIDVRSLPFLVPGSLSPAPGDEAQSPVSLAYTVAQTLGNLMEGDVSASFEPAGELSEGGTRSLVECSDDTGDERPNCSPDGTLEVSGFQVIEAARAFPNGEVEVRIEASISDDPSRTLDATYTFDAVAASPTETNTPTITASRSATSSPTRTATPTDTPSPSPSLTVTSTPTATNTPTVTPIPTDTATNTVEPTDTATPTVTPAVRLGIRIPSGGDPPLELSVSLDSAGGQVVAIQNDIAFDPPARILSVEGEPACSVNLDLGKNDGGFVFLPPGCTPGVNCRGVRAAIVGFAAETAIAPGTVLYQCDIDDAGRAFTCPDAKYSPPAPAPVPAPAAECVVETQ